MISQPRWKETFGTWCADNAAPFALLGYGSGAAEVTVVAPSVLIDDLELSKADDEMPKLPLVPSPATGAQTAALK